MRVFVALLLLAALPANAAGNIAGEWPNSLVLSIHQPQRPSFSAATSLPDGTDLLVTLRRIASLNLADRAPYTAQATSTVRAGSFATEAFRDGAADLKPGEYLVEVDAALPEDFIGPARQIGDPVEALRHNTERAVLTATVYAGPVNRHAYYQINFFVAGPGGREARGWFGVPR